MIHKHYNTCMTRNHALMINFTSQDMQALQYLCMSKHERTIIVSTNLMLHPHPKLVHLREILKYKLYSIIDSLSITANVKHIGQEIRFTKYRLTAHYLTFKEVFTHRISYQNKWSSRTDIT